MHQTVVFCAKQLQSAQRLFHNREDSAPCFDFIYSNLSEFLNTNARETVMLIITYIWTVWIRGFSHCDKCITYWLHTLSSNSKPGRKTGKNARSYAALTTAININKLTEICWNNFQTTTQYIGTPPPSLCKYHVNINKYYVKIITYTP